MNSIKIDEEVQANLPNQEEEEDEVKIRPLERIKHHPKLPVEPPLRANASHDWILKDGRENPEKGSVMRVSYTTPMKPVGKDGIRKQILRNFFWQQMVTEVIEELNTTQPPDEHCSEYDANYVKEGFEPRTLAVSADANVHLKYPLYGTGSSPVTFYSETVEKTGPREILEKFRRCQYFTRPMEERLDDGWVL